MLSIFFFGQEESVNQGPDYVDNSDSADTLCICVPHSPVPALDRYSLDFIWFLLLLLLLFFIEDF